MPQAYINTSLTHFTVSKAPPCRAQSWLCDCGSRSIHWWKDLKYSDGQMTVSTRQLCKEHWLASSCVPTISRHISRRIESLPREQAHPCRRDAPVRRAQAHSCRRERLVCGSQAHVPRRTSQGGEPHGILCTFEGQLIRIHLRFGTRKPIRIRVRTSTRPLATGPLRSPVRPVSL